MDVLDVFVSTKDVEGVGIEDASDAIENVPAKVESGLFVIGEGRIRSSQNFVKPCAAVQRVNGVLLESDKVGNWSRRVLVVDIGGFDDFGTLDNRE